MPWNETIQSVAGIATALGVGTAAVQIGIARRDHRRGVEEQRAAFEQSFVDRYRSVVGGIPLDFLLDGGEYRNPSDDARRAFYDYFELCEDELFQRELKGRVSDETWEEWESGIKSNFARPAFRGAWDDLSANAGDQFLTLQSWVTREGLASKQLG